MEFPGSTAGFKNPDMYFVAHAECDKIQVFYHPFIVSLLLIKHNNRRDLIMCMGMYIPHGRHYTVRSIFMGCSKDMHSSLYRPDT